MKSVRVPAYAKVNLRLDVLGRRADGYHELRTIFQTISLHDTLVLETQARTRHRSAHRRKFATRRRAGPGQSRLSRARMSLAARLDFERGVRAVLTKRIPVGRGLGGGSSDAAAALVGLVAPDGKAHRRRAPDWKSPSGLGADVPFFLHGGRALGIGRGDEIYPLPDVPRRAGAGGFPARHCRAHARTPISWLRASELTKRPDAH